VTIAAIKGQKMASDAVSAFYAFPAEHWAHLRTTHPSESTFATLRHRLNHTLLKGEYQH
jgi:transposase-like protein